MKKIIILVAAMLFINNALAIALGDYINGNSARVQITSNRSMSFVTSDAKHSEYKLITNTGTTMILVNNKGQVYGFNWQDRRPALSQMLGPYKNEFDIAFKNRANKFNHRYLDINSPHLHIEQFGLPGAVMQGEMTATDLAPAN
ncbi:MAG: DUF2844 domain-containing protein [Burkholderiales bacterium]|nr:DUF2844 domain-containing protein [Burkholderiales bacterium]